MRAGGGGGGDEGGPGKRGKEADDAMRCLQIHKSEGSSRRIGKGARRRNAHECGSTCAEREREREGEERESELLVNRRTY